MVLAINQGKGKAAKSSITSAEITGGRLHGRVCRQTKHHNYHNYNYHNYNNHNHKTLYNNKH